MNEVSIMRLGVLRELRNIRKFLDHMERDARSRKQEAIEKAYLFIKTMVYHMDEGDLTPLSIELHKQLLLSEEEQTRQASSMRL